MPKWDVWMSLRMLIEHLAKVGKISPDTHACNFCLGSMHSIRMHKVFLSLIAWQSDSNSICSSLIVGKILSVSTFMVVLRSRQMPQWLRGQMIDGLTFSMATCKTRPPMNRTAGQGALTIDQPYACVTCCFSCSLRADLSAFRASSWKSQLCKASIFAASFSSLRALMSFWWSYSMCFTFCLYTCKGVHSLSQIELAGLREQRA